MHNLVMMGIAVGFTALLLWFRSLLFRRRKTKAHRVYLVSYGDDDRGRNESSPPEDWPSVIEEDEVLASSAAFLSEEEHIELAVMQDRILRKPR